MKKHPHMALLKISKVKPKYLNSILIIQIYEVICVGAQIILDKKFHKFLKKGVGQ